MKALGDIKLLCTVIIIMEMLGYVHSALSCHINVLCFLKYKSIVHRNTKLAVQLHSIEP